MKPIFPTTLLLVEDSPGDVRLTQEAFRDANQAIRLHVAWDGAEAMAFLNRQGANTQRSSSRSDLAGSESPQDGWPPSSGPDQGGRKPENDSHCDPHHIRRQRRISIKVIGFRRIVTSTSPWSWKHLRPL